VKKLLSAKVHELKLLAGEFLKLLYKDGKLKIKEYIFLAKFLNSWDLVDFTAPYILGDYLLSVNFKQRKGILLSLLNSPTLWEKRVAIIACWPLIKKGQFDEFEFVLSFFKVPPDKLLQKALGWMLREVGKVDLKKFASLLEANLANISSLTLSYALEKHSKSDKSVWKDRHRKHFS
jgi:3-methyladenine DNA glycosylase AlkD